MRLRSLFSVAAFALLTLGLRAALAPSATEISPLPVGAKAPAVVVTTIEGTELNLTAALAQKPTVLIFYRGSWCPYCNKHLASLAGIEPQLLELGYQIIALSPDDAKGLQAMMEKNQLNYRLLSDHAMQAASAFGVAFRVDAPTIEAYKGYGVTLTPVPGEPAARWLPVPAVFVIGRDGTIRFMHANPDYKVRLSAEALLVAAKSAL